MILPPRVYAAIGGLGAAIAITAYLTHTWTDRRWEARWGAQEAALEARHARDVQISRDKEFAATQYATQTREELDALHKSIGDRTADLLRLVRDYKAAASRRSVPPPAGPAQQCPAPERWSTRQGEGVIGIAEDAERDAAELIALREWYRKLQESYNSSSSRQNESEGLRKP